MATHAAALAAHGTPRATGDLDIWIDATPENAARVLGALKVFGAGVFDLTIEDLSILSSISGVSFNEAWGRRVEVAIGDLLL